MEMSSFRHKVLASNIANTNTPRYKAKEFDMPTEIEQFQPSGKVSKRLRLNSTSRGHLRGGSAGDNYFASHNLKDPYEVKPNGNTVSMQQQIMKISGNRKGYDAALKLYSTSNELYGAILGK
jgi:flagellar basal-body rod protein FlgB